MTDYQLPPTHLRNKVESFYTAEQMQQAYASGRESMREECLQECSAEATDNGTAQRIAKAIEEICYRLLPGQAHR